MNDSDIRRSDEIVELLKQIRDDQRGWIERSDRAMEESHRVQAESVQLQAAMGSLYRKVLLVSSVLVVAIGILLGCALAFDWL